MVRACTFPGCGRRTADATTRRCALHPPGARGDNWQLQQARRQLRATATHCWICGGPATPADPFTVDHVLARSHGGGDEPSNLRAAHASCNSRRGTGHSHVG